MVLRPLKEWTAWCIKRGLLLALGLLLGLGVVEAIIRAAPSVLPLGFRVCHDFQQPYTQWDEEFLVRGIPNLNLVVDSHPEYRMDIKLNSLGYRDQLTGGKVHALVVGDSFTFGTGVDAEDCYCERLEALTGKPFVNMGIGGYGPSQCVKVLEQDGARFDTDLVIFAVFSNDVSDCGAYKAWHDKPSPRWPTTAAPAAPQAKAAPTSPGEALRCLRDGARDLVTATRTYQLINWTLKPDARERQYKMSLHYCKHGLDLEFNEGILLSWIDPSGGGKEENWQLFDKAIQDAHAWTKLRHARLVVVYLPNKEEVYKHARLEAGGSPEFDLRYEAMRSRVGDVCRRQEAHFLDLTVAFQQQVEAGAKPLYFRWDGHWTRSGHELAAQEIHRYLVEEQLAPLH